MKRRRISAVSLIGAGLVLTLGGGSGFASEAGVKGQSAVQHDALHVLVYSRTNGWRHDSPDPNNENAAITAGKAVMQQLADANNFTVEFSEDNAIMNPVDLAHFDVVMFLNTTSNLPPLCPTINDPNYPYPCGDNLTAAQQTAFENWYRQGGGWVGTHSAADTEKPIDPGDRWPWYGGLLGNNAWFARHGGQNDPACLSKNPTETNHISISALPDPWIVADEWYQFTNDPRTNIPATAEVPHTPVHVVLTRNHPDCDNTDPVGSNGPNFYPAAWYHEYDGGRAFYTARGHGRGDWLEPEMQDHILGAVLWAAGIEEIPGDVTPPTVKHFLSGDWSPGGTVNVTLAATDQVDGSGVASTEYRAGVRRPLSGPYQTYTGPIPISGDGPHVVEYRSTDNAGNVAAGRVRFIIGEPPPENTSPPVLSGSSSAGSRLTCSPGTWTQSGPYTYRWLRDGGEFSNPARKQSIYRSTQSDVGTQIACEVRRTSIRGPSAFVRSNAITVE